MDNPLKLMGHCLSALVLLAVLCGILPVQSTISGTLYANTVALDTVAIAAGSRAMATVGGIYPPSPVRPLHWTGLPARQQDGRQSPT